MKTTRLLWSALVLLALGASAALAEPRECDVWYAFVADGKRYGYQHLMVSKLPDGNYRYRLDARMLIDVFGAQRQEIESHSECVVTAAYRPVSLSGRSKAASGPTRATGAVEGNVLKVSTDGDGYKSTRLIDLASADIFEVCLDDWLHDQPADVESLTVRVIREETWHVQPARLTRRNRDASGSTWEVVIGDGEVHGTIAYDARGVATERRLDVPKLLQQRCPAEQAQDIDYHVLAGRELLTFPMDKDIPGADRLTELTVKLTWKDIPFDKFELEDIRQGVVERSETDGRYRAIVRIKAPPPSSSEQSYPVEAPIFAPYLAESRFIKPHDDEIARAARLAVEGKKNARDAVQALCAWVFDYIEGSMIAETLSGPEVLRRKQGKCSEYSTLFASLARSVGIPTRIVLGERMVAGNWAGHMWNEAHVGQWIPVDASANEVGESFALLKFIHSDTVMGTQNLRWALTESLEISIEDFKLSPSPLAGRYEAGVQGNIYTNVDYACRLTAPGDDWPIEVDSEVTGRVVVRFRVPENDEVQIHFVAFALPPGTPATALLDARLKFFEGRYKGFELLDRQARTVLGAAGDTIRFRRDPIEKELAKSPAEAGSSKVVTSEVMWSQGSSGYLLNLIAEESTHDRHKADLDKLLASFEYLGDE